MFPLRDDNPAELRPWITLAIMAACVWIWIQVQGAGGSMAALTESVCTWGAIPAEVTGRAPAVPDGGAPCRLGGLRWEAVLTSMFLHGGWMHLIGNLWFLWIFGNNIEDSMGHLRFAVFYLVAGIAAAGAHIAISPGDVTPMVGASGAISGVMGAYLVLYPKARVQTLFVIVILIQTVWLPAWVILGYWFLLQGLGGWTDVQFGQGGGGVAYAAHVGGFVAGVVLVKLFARRTLVDAKRGGIVLSPWEIEHRGWW